MERGRKGKGFVTRAQTMGANETPIFAIGDSVMLGTTNELLARIPGLGIDAQVGRQVAEGIRC